jgi:hypothetical protein
MQCRDRPIDAGTADSAEGAAQESLGLSPRNRNKKRLALKASDKIETTGCLSRPEVEPGFQRLLHWGPPRARP